MAFNIWKWEEKGNEITGKLIMKKNNMPPFGKKLYGIELDNGEIWYVWGTYILVGLLAPLPFFARIRIRYLGKGRNSPDDKHDMVLFDMTVISLPEKSKRAKQLQNKLEKILPDRRKEIRK